MTTNPALEHEMDVQRARRILREQAGWEADQHEPPSLRDGHRLQYATDVDWARAILALEIRMTGAA